MLSWVQRVAAASTLSLMLCVAAQAQESRVALVIGNGTYQNTAPLRNPANDARGMAAALRGSGFDVILKENAGRRAFIEGLREFAAKLSPGGVGLFFYAGHGLQAKGANYLVPVDAVLTAEDDLRYEAIDVNDVLGRMEEARVQLSLVILDACRDNPFLRASRSASRGLAQVDAGRGTFIAYATAPGKTAADGDGENGLYTAELLRSLKVPGLTLEEVFKRTMDGVERQSASTQTPWSSSSFRGKFIFNAAASPAPGQAVATATPAPTAPAAPSAPRGEAVELAFWTSIANSTNPADFESYLRRFPNGTFVDLARNRLEGLKKPQTAAVVPPAAAVQPSPASPPPAGQTPQPGSVGQSKNIAKEQSRLRVALPGFDKGRERYQRRPASDDFPQDIYYFLGVSQAAYPRAQIWLHILPPNRVWTAARPLDETWLRSLGGVFKDKEIKIASVAPGTQDMLRVTRFSVEGAECVGFSKRFGDFAHGPAANGYFCGGVGEALTDQKVAAVLAGVTMADAK
jgi:hypothetical protein